MTDHAAVPRREFVRALSVTSALAAVGSACASGGSVHAASAAPPPSPTRRAWDTSWIARLTAPHRVVFNVTQLNGTGLMQAGMMLDGFAQGEGLKDSDVNVVLMFRHQAVATLLDDTMWERIGITASGGGSQPATPGNPFRRAKAEGPMVEETLPSLMQRGAIVLGCNQALGGQISRLREKENLPREEADRIVRAAVIPGAIIVPNGIYGVTRAQIAGCAYFSPG